MGNITDQDVLSSRPRHSTPLPLHYNGPCLHTRFQVSECAMLNASS